MGTIASLNLVLSAQTKELDSGIDKGSARIKRFGGELEQFKKKAEGGGGLLGGLGRSLKAEAMEDRKSGEKQLQQLLMGGGFGMTHMLTEVVNHDLEKIGETTRKNLMGKGNLGDLFEDTMGSMPAIGEGWKMGRNIKRNASDMWALWKEHHGSSRAEVFDSMSDDTQADIQNLMSETSAKMNEANAHAMRETQQRGLGTSLIGLKGSNRLDQLKKVDTRQNLLDVRAANEELSKLKQDMNDPANEAFKFMPVGEKNNMLLARKNALQGDISSKAAERAAQLKEAKEQYNDQKKDMLEGGGDRVADLKGNILQSGLAAKGHEHMAYLQGVENTYNQQIRAVDKWQEANNKAYPDAIAQTKKLADEQRHLLANQRHMAEMVPLMSAIRGIDDSATYARAALNGNPFAKQLHDLQEMGATHKQVAQAQRQMQVAADVPLAQQTRASTRTPLEQLKKDMTDLNRMKEEDLVSPEDYERRKGDLADQTRKSLGLFGDPQKVGAMEMHHGFSVNAEPQLADPVSKLLGVQTNTLKESQRQRIALEKLAANKAVILSLDDLPGNGK